MSRILEVQRYIDLIRGVRTPVALQNLVSEATREIGFDMITLFQHADISRVVSSLDHMRRGELVGISSCPLSWTEHYRDHNLIRIDPRVIAVRGTVEPFVSEDVGRFVRVTAAHRVLAEAQRKANIGETFVVPFHFPGEPSGSSYFGMRYGRSIPHKNLAMAHWFGCSAFQAARSLLFKARGRNFRGEQPRLSDRQLQCTVLIGRGLSINAISRRLAISPETVKHHLREARSMLGVSKSIHLVTIALNEGQITMRDLCDDNLRRAIG
jgi:LuxR family transcriptional regulator, quorum-sensing system regulator CciR